ncbi:MAG: hypothetical protein H0T46_27100 [Deltaproteobacteria bacterium]|nr:hypothetical protein [Deltaproteobacteria bacterium]
MWLRTSTVLLALAACGDGGGDDGGGNLPDGSMPPSIQYMNFTGRTRSLGTSSTRLYSVTDTQGAIACGVANDFEAALGTQGSQVIIALDSFMGGVCPTGTHSIQPAANCPVPMFGNVRDKCAYYRRYDQQARLIGTLPASAGAVTFTGDEQSCTVTVNLSFSGQAFTDTVTLTNGLVANPWCR